MAAEFRKGDAAERHSSQGTIEGRVGKKLTQATDVEGHRVAASVEHPEYLVRSDRTGAAAHEPGALKKKSA